MYQRSHFGWTKHLDFMILDLLCLNVAFCVAFFIRLAAKDAAGNLIVPAFWRDNYVSIPPRGEIQVTCDLSEEPQTLTFNGWNTAE